MDRCKRPGSVQAREMHPVPVARPDLDPSCRCSINSVILPRRSFIFNMNYRWLLSALALDYCLFWQNQILLTKNTKYYSLKYCPFEQVCNVSETRMNYPQL